MKAPRLGWADYVAGHPERLPRCEFETWADVPRGEYRRVTRNYNAWRKRRQIRGEQKTEESKAP